jgi:uncharacterized protein (DUF58 family)
MTEPPRRWSRRWWSAVTPIPTVRAAVVLAVGAAVAAVAPAPAGAVLVVGALLAAVVADAALAPAPWRIAVTRELPRVITLEGSGEVAWRIGNPVPRPVEVALADDLAPSLGAQDRRVRVRLPAAGTVRPRTALHPTRRGTFRPTELTVRVVGPLGLAVRQTSRDLPGHLEVHPSFRSRAAAELRLRRARLAEVGTRSIRGRGGGTEFEALRDHVEGDEFRHVDWAATARTGHPIVRTYRPERNQTVIVLLDTGRVVAGLVDGVPRLDHGMDATLALATVARGMGDRVGLVAFGAEVRAVVAPRHDPGQLRRLSSAMHALEPELAESSYREAFRTTLARFRRRAMIVLLTELAAEAVQETLLPALPLVVRHHLVVVASASDPALTAMRSAPIDAAGDAYRAAAATTVDQQRRRAGLRLQQAGAEVVDAPPGQLAGRLVDRYLDVKARGGL